MSKHNATVAIFNGHTGAEQAVKELQEAGFDIKKLSLVGKDYHSDEHVVGYYNTGDRMRYWGTLGAFWGGLWGLLFGSAFFFVPGIGPIVVGGPIVAWIVGALQGAVVIGGISAVGAAMVQHRYSERQRAQVRDLSQGKQVPVGRPRNRGRSGESQWYPAGYGRDRDDGSHGRGAGRDNALRPNH